VGPAVLPASPLSGGLWARNIFSTLPDKHGADPTGSQPLAGTAKDQESLS